VKKVKGINGKKLIDDATEVLSKELGFNIAQFHKGTIEDVQKEAVTVYEIDLDELLKSYKLPANASYNDLGFGPASTNIYKKISQYPFIVRDIAVFVGELVKAEDVWATIENSLKKAKSIDLLVRHALFDTFKKDGKVSYAFRLVFQSMDRTLTDDEANKVMVMILIEKVT
jgi:phenylalanyl-tRNA synthetase beta subunit